MLSFLKANEDHKQKTTEDYKPTKINSNFNTELAAKVAVENERFANLPPVRECGVVEFSFSERQFPAPKRESNKGGLFQKVFSFQLDLSLALFTSLPALSRISQSCPL